MKNEKGIFLMAAIPLLAILFISVGIYEYNAVNTKLDIHSNMMNNTYNYFDDADDDEDDDLYNYSSNTTINNTTTDFDWDV